MSVDPKVIAVVLQREVRAFIHNDVGNAAHFLITSIRSRLVAEDMEGIFLDQMACVLMVAFSHEANVNFIGWKLQEMGKLASEKWDERAATKDKLKVIINTVAEGMDWNKRPLSTLAPLKVVRDALAHGKPRLVTSNEPVTGTYDELYQLSHQELLEDWEKILNQDFVEAAYADVDQIYALLLDKGGIQLGDTLSGQSGGMTLLQE